MCTQSLKGLLLLPYGPLSSALLSIRSLSKGNCLPTCPCLAMLFGEPEQDDWSTSTVRTMSEVPATSQVCVCSWLSYELLGSRHGVWMRLESHLPCSLRSWFSHCHFCWWKNQIPPSPCSVSTSHSVPFLQSALITEPSVRAFTWAFTFCFLGSQTVLFSHVIFILF